MSSSPSAHKPRRKKKGGPVLTRSATITDIVTVDAQTNAVNPEFPLVAFLWPARGTTSQWVLIPLILMIVGLFRWCVGLWGYSGFQVPPMHGDYEAQRHWMEITSHLPMEQWYFYDLQYWGLDYPPLTAYHSKACGMIGKFINPEWFALDASRGIEDQLLKVYMRATVIVSEYLVYVPALIIFIRHYSRNQGTGVTASSIALVGILMQPATMLIDHGHFQYNTVMLGFMVATMSSIYADRLLTACVFFVAALGFKQMALYYAPVIFAYLLGSCLTPHFRFGQLIAIATVTLLSFAVMFAPLLLGSIYDLRDQSSYYHQPLPTFINDMKINIDNKSPIGIAIIQMSQVVHRCFPFARGLFEDKVANFWCAVNTLYKLRKIEAMIPLSRLSLFATFMSILPSVMIIGAMPRRSLLPYALASTAWGFFLFSFQVHEKSVLLPLLPMTLLLASKNGLSKEYRAWIGYANNLAVWTMYPLLNRDGLKTPYVVVSFLWAYLMGMPPTSFQAYYDPELENVPGRPLAPDELRTPTKILHWQSIIVMAFWHILNAFAVPPDDKPDLWVVVNACFGAFGFGICYMWCTWKLILESGMIDFYFAGHGAFAQTDEIEEVEESMPSRAQTTPAPSSEKKKKKRVTIQE